MKNCIIIAAYLFLLTLPIKVLQIFLVCRCIFPNPLLINHNSCFYGRVIQQNNKFNLGPSTPAIGFSAVLTHNVYLGNNQAVIYGNILTNVGNGYNKLSGHFIVPRKGLYVFSCTVRANTNEGITVGIVHNGRPVLIIASSVYSPETASGTVVLALKKGDNVWVRCLNHGRHIEGHHNYFSGYLISTEI